jgi:iron(III) transport system permease protein
MRNKLSFWSVFSFLVSLVLTFPLAYIFYAHFLPDEGSWEHISKNLLAQYGSETFWVSVGTMTLVLVWALPSAWLLQTRNFFLSGMLRRTMVLPLAIPAYYAGYTYTHMISLGGSLQNFLQLFTGEYTHIPFLSLPGATFIMSLALYPYVYSTASIAFARNGQSLIESARIAGKSEFSIFFRIALPVARPAIFAGLFLVLMEVLNEYGTFKYFGVSTFTTGIFKAWFALGDKVSAVRLSAILMLLTGFLMLAEKYSRRGKAFSGKRTNTKAGVSRRDFQGWKSFLAFFVCAIPLFLGFVLPVLQMLFWAAKTYSVVLSAEFYDMIFRTLGLAFLSALLISLTAMIFAFAKRLQPHFLLQFSIAATKFGYASPGAIIAVGITFALLFFETRLAAIFPDKSAFWLVGTWKVPVIAYMLRFMAVGLSSVQSGLDKISVHYDETARISGKSNFFILTRIHLPLLKKAFAASLLLSFVDIVKELPLILILRPFNFDTLSVKVFELADQELTEQAAVPAVVMILVGLLPVFLMNYLTEEKAR